MKSKSLKQSTENLPKKGKVQPKLKVSTPGDAYEREADAMAEKVMKRTNSNSVIARSLKDSSSPEKKDKGNASVRRKVSDNGSVLMSPSMMSNLVTPQQSGEPLSNDTRTLMEDSFNRDFSGVRIHKDQHAAGMNREINAKAFTYGNDIYFNQGQFSPETPEGKNLLAHELTHVVQHDEDTTSPDISRAVELRPPGKGEASAFDRVQELIDRLNQQSTAIQYRLDGHKLLYEVKDEKALSIFDMQMRSYLDMDAVVPLRLITGEGRVPKGPTTLGRLTFDQLITGYVDMEDLLSTDRLAFQSILIHILAERFSSPNYARRIGGNTFTGQEFKATHLAGHHAQAFHFQGVFKDPSIRFVYEEPKPGGKAHIVFRSSEKKYEVFVIVSRTNEDIAHAEVRVRDADLKWYTADEFLARNTATVQPAVQPQLATSQGPRADELKAVEKAKQITEKPTTESGGNIMRKVNSTSSITPSADWINELNASGTGAPLPDGARRFMEGSFQSDFSGVRIHTGESAASLSEDIHAKAFTYNGAIYFNRGEFSPDSNDGKRLLAHELTHVLQQRGENIKTSSNANHVSRAPSSIIFRQKRKKANDPKPEVDKIPAPFFKNDDGLIDILTQKVVKIFKLKYVPEKLNKLPAELRKNRVRNKKERLNTQRDKWKAELNDTVKPELFKKIQKKGKGSMVKEGDETFYFFKLTDKKHQNKHKVYVIGTPEDIVQSIITPRWNRDGKYQMYHVDHILEWQIGGGYEDEADKINNYWLWEAGVNMSAGSKLANLIDKTIDGIVDQAIEAGEIWDLPKGKTKKKFAKEKAKEIKAKNSDFKIEFDELIPKLEVKGDPKDSFDKKQTFTDADPLEGLTGMTEGEVNALRGTKNKLSIMIGDILVREPLRIDNDFSGTQATWIKGFTIKKVLDYNENAKPGEKYASIQGELYREQTKKKLATEKVLDITVFRIGFGKRGKKEPYSEGLMYFGKIENGFREHVLTTVELPGSSPIEIQNAFFSEDGIAVLEGKVKPTLSFLKGLEFDIVYSGNDVTLKKTFTTDDLSGKLPRPFDITNAEITLSASLREGFGVDGQVDFMIDKIGTGFIRGEKKEGFVLEGGFEFEKGFFDKSGITVGYRKEPGAEEGKFSFKGFAEKEGDKTIKSARIEVNYENNILTARGKAITKLPGISEGSIEVVTGEGKTSVVADFVIGDSIPGVKGGNLHFLFKKDEEGKYLIEASSEIHTKFPGIPRVKLKGFYNSDGVFLFEGDAELHLGRFNGIVHFGITNQEVDEKGQLTGKKGDKLIAFGKGVVDFKMSDWLQGKIGAEITPDARVELKGELRPDPHLPITKKEEEIHKRFGEFNLPQFTLFGIPKIAEIFVTASGGFFLDAGIGPLYLNNAVLKFEKLDIEAPEKTVVEGSGALDLPGYAQLGVRITIKAGLGILVVDVILGLTGSLAFEIRGNAGFQMAFTWSVATGIQLKEALATLKAQTALVAKLGGKLEVELDLFFTEITLYERPFDIGEKRWPLGLDLDLKFPLGFDGGEAGSFKLPHPDSIKHDDPKVDSDTVKKGAMEDPPSVEPAPGKEEALWKTRVLKADATASHWIQRLYERYSYVDGLKKKYPNVNWGYLDEELQILDAKEFRNLHDTLLYKVDFPRSEFGKKLRLSALSNFEEEHRYVNPVEAADLRSKIQQMKEE